MYCGRAFIYHIEGIVSFVTLESNAIIMSKPLWDDVWRFDAPADNSGTFRQELKMCEVD